MAHFDTGHSGKGKPVNVEYNLVPFIDLLSCLIAFLLMTAVWTQISMIQTNEGTSGGERSEADFTLALYVYKDRQELSIGNKKTVRIPKKSDEYDLDVLMQEFAAMKQSYPNKKDILILAQDKVLYKELIKTMDAAIGSDIANITLSGMLE